MEGSIAHFMPRGAFSFMEKTFDRKTITVIYAIWAISLQSTALNAGTMKFADNFTGALQQYKVKDEESLLEISRRFDLGLNAIVAANPGVDPIIPKPGTLVTIPGAWILPDVSSRPAIVINLPEFRLYYFPDKFSDTVVTFPLGIGDEGNDTPVGNFRVIEKIVRPAWHVPTSIRAQEAGLPKVVPPGPDNPMGSHALRLSLSSVLIHGTNRPWGIGTRSSHGCLRLYPEDIVRFYDLVPKGMKVVIVNQPIKVGAKEKRVFVEVHRYERGEPGVGQALHLLADKKMLTRVDFAKLIRAINDKLGFPVDVTLTR